MVTKARQEWEKKNRVVFSICLQRSTDSDVLDYIDDVIKDGQSRNGLIKDALREKMAREQQEKRE